ncbi:Hypothetical predicted protein [Lecanosticta acicola]|uniref:Uncharacterized protein n=1 Tax=Lecanosticta acicola TaxID=111012 RepID=A0AAI8Z671_9PEZI|nr:Hypothetical predicted protein [Lecanosticta acicola]
MTAKYSSNTRTNVFLSLQLSYTKMPGEVVHLTSTDVRILRTISITTLAAGTQVECQYSNCTNHRGKSVLIAIHERCLDVASLVPCTVGSVNAERLKWVLERLWIVCSCKHHRFQGVLNREEKLERLMGLEFDIQGEEEVMCNATPGPSRNKRVRGCEDMRLDEVSSKKLKVPAFTPDIISRARLEDPFTTPTHKDNGKGKAPLIMTPTPAAPLKHMEKLPLNLMTTTATPTPVDPASAASGTSFITCSCCSEVFSPAVQGEHFLSWCMKCRASWEVWVQLGMVVDPFAVKASDEDKKLGNAGSFNKNHVTDPSSSAQSANIACNNVDFSLQNDQAKGLSNAKNAAVPTVSSGLGFDTGDNDPLGFNLPNKNGIVGDPQSFSGWTTAGSLPPSSALGFGGTGPFGFNSTFGKFDFGVDSNDPFGFNKTGPNVGIMFSAVDRNDPFGFNKTGKNGGTMFSGTFGSNTGGSTAFGFGNNDRGQEFSSRNTSAVSSFPPSDTSRSGSGGVDALGLGLSSHNVGDDHTKNSNSDKAALTGMDEDGCGHLPENNGQTQDSDSNNIASATYQFDFDVSNEQTDNAGSLSAGSGESSNEQPSSSPVHVHDTGIAHVNSAINNGLSDTDPADHTSSSSSTSDPEAADEFDSDFDLDELDQFNTTNANTTADNLADPSHEDADHEDECPTQAGQ